MSTGPESCIKCGSCARACPVVQQEGEKIFPGPRTLAVDIPRTGRKIVPDRSELMLCSTCHACAAACPMQIDLPSIMMEQRSRSFHLGRLRPGHRKMMDNIDAYGFSVAPATMGPVTGKGEADTAYFPGCIATWRERAVLDDTLSLLRSKGFSIEIPDGLMCCGSPLEKVGDKEKRERCIHHNMGILERYDRVISSCPGCVGQLVEHYGLEALHTVELLSEEGLPRHAVYKGNVKVALHQPCHLNRLVGPHTKDCSIALLQTLIGVEVVDMEGAERCCGAGGSLLSGYPDVAARMASDKVKWAREAGADVLLASCPFCVTNLRKVNGIEVNDLISFLRSQIR